MMTKKDLTGRKFNHLRVVSRAPNSAAREVQWNCLCDCGKESVVRGSCLMRGHTKSCGCLQIERATKHGSARRGKRSAEFRAWDSAKQRCCNPNDKSYKDYGGRGISMYEEWRNDFMAFYLYMGPRPEGLTLDRIDNNGNYEPGNCRWASQKTQGNNKRNNVILSFKGKTQTFSQWCEELGIKPSTLDARLRRGWDTERALSL